MDITDRIDNATEKLLIKIEQALDGDKSLEVKDFKAVTGALKELRELQKNDSAAAADKKELLTVRFLGDAEEMSL